jgi:lysophospholipase L1-like esterase
MKQHNKLKLIILPFLVLMTSFTSPNKVKIYLIGDSTIAIKEANKYPETGWGVPFSLFFSESAEVDNRAKNGRSTKSFITEKRWDSVLDSLKANDYVLIQFGHNDEVHTKKSATTPEEFVENLTKYVKETKSKNAFPILITPVARRKFDEQGKVIDTHKEYAELVRVTAKKLNVPLIDLSEKSMKLLQEFGEDKSKLLFLHLEENQNVNYPKGVKDDTHFSDLGARYMAEIVMNELKKIQSPLANYSIGSK